MKREIKSKDFDVMSTYKALPLKSKTPSIFIEAYTLTKTYIGMGMPVRRAIQRSIAYFDIEDFDSCFEYIENRIK